MKTLQITRITASLALALAAATSTAAEAPLPKALPAFAPAKAFTAAKVEQRKLANGMTVWVVPRSGIPKVTAVLAFKGGISADDAATPALTNMMAGLLNEGTPTRTSRQIAEALQAIGGDYSAAASNDAVTVSGSALASGTDALLGLMADTVQHASFPAEEVQLAQANAAQGLKARASNPDWLAQTAFLDAVYGAHPYARTSLNAATIEAATPRRLQALRAERLRPDRAVLVLVGQVKPADVMRMAEQQFGGWRATGGAAADLKAAPRSAAPARVLVPRPGSVQSTLRYGQPTLAMRDPDYVALNLTNMLLGGGFTSKIMKIIREEKGYSYSPGSRSAVGRLGGAAYTTADVRNDVTGATLEELDKIYASLGHEAATKEELEGAKRLTTGIFLLQNEQQAMLALTLANYWVQGLPANYAATYVDHTNRLTAADIQRVGKTYFAPSKQTIVVVGDPAAISGQLKAHGEFKQREVK